MHIEVAGVERLHFADGSPVRAASAVAELGDGFLVVQDDATHAAWFRDGPASSVRVLPSVEGLDVLDEATGSKHLKPDLEAACPVTASLRSCCSGRDRPLGGCARRSSGPWTGRRTSPLAT